MVMAPNCFVKTISERCRVCYTCVRECPAKAIRISEGQAEIIPERCIGCGNCVRVCSQQAKKVVSGTEQVEYLLASENKVAACIAPSFPAEFWDLDYRKLVGMLHRLGFAYVNEVAFGADLVARAYRILLENSENRQRYISTSCPAVVRFVEKYHPEFIDSLVPVVSPMVATARVLHHLHGAELKVVFIGPCIAKKCEAAGVNLLDEIDAALTFVELRQMLYDSGIESQSVELREFDPPHAGLGLLFPIGRGLLQAAGITEDLMTGEIVATDGRTNFVEAISEFNTGNLRLLEVLACNGCIMGAGMSVNTPLFTRRSLISRHVRSQIKEMDQKQWQADVESFSALDLSCSFMPDDQRIAVPFEEEISLIMAKMGKLKPEDELNCGACGYDNCREHAMAIFKGLAESEMCLPHTIEQLRMTISKLATSDEQLANTREALIQSEKLASMGQLAAGIAHEVNNPLGVVLMYAHLLMEKFGNHPSLGEDLKMIVEQTDRCKKIVAQLLHFSRQNKLQLQRIDIVGLAEKVIRVLPRTENIRINWERDIADSMVDVDPDQITQVLTNLVNNAYFAMPEGGTLTLGLTGNDHQIRIMVKDTGIGIPRNHMTKLFEPFFTTKGIGKGTGLGLAVAYGIVKMHRGNIEVESNADAANGPTGTRFTVILLRNGK